MADGEGPHRTDHDPAEREARFRALYDEHVSRIYRFVVRATDGDDEAQDLTAEVFTVAWRRLDDIPPSPEDRLWLFGVARNIVARSARSRLRRQRLAERLHGEPPTCPADLTSSFDHLHIGDAVAKLPRREREVIHLIAWEQLSQHEAAVVLGCSVGALRVRLFRARRRLAQALGMAPIPQTPKPPVPATLEVTPWKLN